jgi:hypothetical protein
MFDYFTLEENRSERALQAAHLIPALADRGVRWKLLSAIKIQDGVPIVPDESDRAAVMHFVWVLRDGFSAERKYAEKTKSWAALGERWRLILGLPGWASDANWWRHTDGSYKEDSEYPVHPCSRDIGWTGQAIRFRAERFGLDTQAGTRAQALMSARKVMNTECDCLVQTPTRLIVVECKDKTNFIPEQERRQNHLFQCMERMLPRPNHLVYVEISSQSILSRPNQWWSWELVSKYGSQLGCG